MVVQCPKCGHKIYQRRTVRRRSIDPSALVERPPLLEEGGWLTTEQVAAELSIKPTSLASMISRKRFPKADYKWRRRNYWKPSTVQRWRQESRQIVFEPAGGWPHEVSSETPPRGEGGRFIKIEAVEITVRP
ncbi:helix-turn-helix domain-containing protein [Nonomuraea sp. NPDC023979]|uniref:helix-turn-helix transcriptional regulator n=1 Tax=Nonomuraea sp. NPDC023979 TaxID=3154796 RepID=UPI0033DEFC6E